MHPTPRPTAAPAAPALLALAMVALATLAAAPAAPPDPPPDPPPASPPAAPDTAEPSLRAAVGQALQLHSWRFPPGAPAGDPAAPDFDDHAWEARALPWDWTGKVLGNDPAHPPPPFADVSSWGGRRTGLPLAWFRTTFDLPDHLQGRRVVLSLGPVGDRDLTFVNGQGVGHTDSPFADRNYVLPPGLLRPTGNVVAVRVRHEAPSVQFAHYHYHWGHSQLGWFAPGGLHERTPTLRAATALDPDNPAAGRLLTPADLPDPADGAVPPGTHLTLDLDSATGRFYQTGSDPARLTVRARHAAALPPEQRPDAVRLDVADAAGAPVGSHQVKLDATGVVAVTLPWPGPGWYRVTATPRRGGADLDLTGPALGGRRAVNWANLLPHQPGPRPQSMFGVAHPDRLAEPMFLAMNAVGARWLRWDVLWDRFEPRPGQYDFDHESIKGVLDLCQRFHIQPLPLLTYCAQWAAHPDATARGRNWLFSPPRDPRVYHDSVRAFATHYRGRFRVYELWNEPMTEHFLNSVEGKSPEQLYNSHVFGPAATAIRAADPDAQILYASQWAEPLMAALKDPQLRPLIDGAAIHPYSSDEPEIGRFGGISTLTVNAAGRTGSQWITDPATGTSYLQPAIPGNVEVWNTEVGWFPTQYVAHAARIREHLNRRQIAAFIPRAYVTSAFRGVRRFFYFSLGQQMFLTDLRQPYPAAVAYSTTAHFLEHARPLAFLPLRLAVPLYVFQDQRDPTRFIAVLWSRGSDYRFALPPGVAATNLYGRPLTDSDDLIPLNQEALFLTLVQPDADPDTARRRFATLAPIPLTTTGALDLWMTQGEAQDWSTAFDAPAP